MVSSASASLAEFKSQRMGGLLSGTGSLASAPSMMGTSLSDTASQRLARSQPKRSSTAFLDTIRASGQRMHQTAIQGFQAKNEAARKAALAGMGTSGSRANPKGGSSKYPTTGYRAPSNADRTSKSGQYGYQSFQGRDGLTVPASDAFTKLENAYKSTFGDGFKVSSGWRSMDQEARYWNLYQAGKGPIASKPGTGVHGYGTAVDINGPINQVASKQHAWMRQNAANYGWYWVGQRFNEPWHWEYFPDKDPSRGR
tara:strand:+ start:31866 stop:32630 length:765 start_codon:yes stop_codon:yes gene_type:complete